MRTSTLAAVALALLCGIGAVVDHAVRPVLATYRIPGMVVGLVTGNRTCAFNYGVANTATRQPVTDGTPTLPGTYRTYASPGIGTLGLITAKSMGESFESLMERQLLPALGMKNTYLHVPAARIPTR